MGARAAYVGEAHGLEVLVADALGGEQLVCIDYYGHAIIAARVHFKVKWPPFEHLGCDVHKQIGR